MAIIRHKVVADFETTTDPNGARVWAACVVDIPTAQVLHIGNSIEGFFDWLKDKNTLCYFHNLKFDGCWIINYLLRNGYEWRPTPPPGEPAPHEPGTFETLIVDTGAFYQITVYFESRNKQWKKVVFQDSLKKLPFKVSQIAKAFDLKDHKLHIDYDAPREPGHELTPEEEAYVVNDCRIVAQALNIQFEKELEKMTIGSDALSNYKATLGGNQYFEKWFPVLPLDIDSFIRKAYKGGITYLKPEHRGRRGLQGIVYDKNSMYPAHMYNDLLPYGYPRHFEGEPVEDPDFPLYVVRFWAAFEVKPGHMPTVQLKNNRAFIETEYLTSSRSKHSDDLEIIELYMTNVDYELFREHYNVYNIRFEEGYRFKGKRGFFKDYIDYWMGVKEQATQDKNEGYRTLAKLMLNNLYGKTATNPQNIKKEPRIDTNGVLHFVERKEKPREPVYTAMGAFITAYARADIVRSAQAVWDRFIYMDTDSLHLIGYDEPTGLDIHSSRLGAWKYEGKFTDSKYLRAKTYMETIVDDVPDTLKNYARRLPGMAWAKRENGRLIAGVTHVTCAGMPDNVKEDVNYENFEPGATFWGKLVPKQVPGGVVLVPRDFTIRS